MKIIWVTWISKLLVLKAESPPCRWILRLRDSDSEVVEQSLMQAREGRLHILEKMAEALKESRTEDSLLMHHALSLTKYATG